MTNEADEMYSQSTHSRTHILTCTRTHTWETHAPTWQTVKTHTHTYYNDNNNKHLKRHVAWFVFYKLSTSLLNLTNASSLFLQHSLFPLTPFFLSRSILLSIYLFIYLYIYLSICLSIVLSPSHQYLVLLRPPLFFFREAVKKTSEIFLAFKIVCYWRIWLLRWKMSIWMYVCNMKKMKRG